MTLMLREHEVDPVTNVCPHFGTTGAQLAKAPQLSCLPRMPSVARDTGPRTQAADDFDFINARIAELAAERVEVMKGDET